MTSMDQYIILGRIGEGAHGVVFKAKNRETGETVALKKVTLRRPEDGVPPQTLREIKALREIEESPHVVRLRAAFAHGPAVVLAFEFVAGDLGGLLRAAAAPLPPARVRALLAMTLRGLRHCHRLRILHRVVPSPGAALRRPALRRGRRPVGRGLHLRGAAEPVAAVPGRERHRAAVLRAARPRHPHAPHLAGAGGASRLPEDLVPGAAAGAAGAAGARRPPGRPGPAPPLPRLPLAPAHPRPRGLAAPLLLRPPGSGPPRGSAPPGGPPAAPRLLHRRPAAARAAPPRRPGPRRPPPGAVSAPPSPRGVRTPGPPRGELGWGGRGAWTLRQRDPQQGGESPPPPGAHTGNPTRRRRNGRFCPKTGAENCDSGAENVNLGWKSGLWGRKL
ncbi:cyclin-dependent kinase 20 isoform X2 [Dromaius novaehollandiae]